MIDASNFTLYAFKYYNNPQCTDIEEFYDDLKKFKYLKKLLNRYRDTGIFSDRLVLNHIITIYNLFGIKPATDLMKYKIEEDHWPALKACLLFLGYIHSTEYEEIQTDQRVMATLEKI